MSRPLSLVWCLVSYCAVGRAEPGDAGVDPDQGRLSLADFTRQYSAGCRWPLEPVEQTHNEVWLGFVHPQCQPRVEHLADPRL